MIETRTRNKAHATKLRMKGNLNLYSGTRSSENSPHLIGGKPTVPSRAELRRIANELALSQRKTELLSLTDQLTGLPNRRSAIAAIQHAWAMSERAGLPLSIIMIDIDHFKQINDGFGHAAGDKTLIEVAKTLRSNLRQDDHVYRIGGEEFLLLSSLSDIKQLIVAAERLRRHIAALRIDYQGQSIQVSISLGLARREASHQHYDALLSSADTALYAAKSGGRNRICYSRLQEIHDLGSSSVRG